MFLFFFVNFCNLIYLITIRRLLRVQKVSTYMTYDIQIQVHQPAPNYKSFLTHTADYKPKAVESTHMKDDVSRVTVKVIYYLRRQLCNCRGVGDRPLSHIHTRHKEHRTRHAGRLRSADLLTFTQRNSLSRLFLQNVPSLLSAIEHRKLSKQVLAKSSICTALISVRYSPLMN